MNINNEVFQFWLTTAVELMTLLCAYLGVRLYKKNWKLRMVLIVVPLLVNVKRWLTRRLSLMSPKSCMESLGMKVVERLAVLKAAAT